MLTKEEIIATHNFNNEIRWMLFDYLNNNSCYINKELIQSVNNGCDLPEANIFIDLVAALCRLDSDINVHHRMLVNNYLKYSIHHLHADTYLNNPYLANINIPKVDEGNWKFTYEEYQPYEAFICNDLILEDDFREIPQIGFFNETFRFPAVMENDREWMAIKPNEIETMKQAINLAHDHVITFGLGLGYFAYMASLKDDVYNVTVIEHDKQIIDIFNKYILPQFSSKGKIVIVNDDAYNYIRNRMVYKRYDYAFVDLWHDTSDGLEIYLKIKKLEKLNENITFMYWIEESLLSSLRWQLFDVLVLNNTRIDKINEYITDKYLRKLAVNTIGK